MPPLISIIIPAHNEARVLPQLLRSITASDPDRALYEIIVVADNCSDATAAVAREYGADQVVITTVANVCLARNEGTAVARGTFLLFIDADQRIISPQFLSTLTRHLHATHGTDIIGTTRAVPQEKTAKAKLLLWVRSVLLSLGLLRLTLGKLFINATLFARLKGFTPEAYPFELFDLVRRSRQQGARFIYIPDLLVANSMRRYERAGYGATLWWWWRSGWRKLFNLPLPPYPPAATL